MAARTGNNVLYPWEKKLTKSRENIKTKVKRVGGQITIQFQWISKDPGKLTEADATWQMPREKRQGLKTPMPVEVREINEVSQVVQKKNW